MDDMVPMAEHLIALQERFETDGKPVHVDIGFHWTQPNNLSRIQTDGLLTKAERDARNIAANFNGSALGDGIYTASDPYSFCGTHYGPICIVVARLKGITITPTRPKYIAVGGVQGNATTTSTGSSTGSVGDTVVSGTVNVLKTSAQCIPLLYFSDTWIRPDDPNWEGNLAVHECHVQLQAILDAALNRPKQQQRGAAGQAHPAKINEMFSNPHSAETTTRFSTVVPKLLCRSEAAAHVWNDQQNPLPVAAAWKAPHTTAASSTKTKRMTTGSATTTASPTRAKRMTTGSARANQKRRKK
ncbi:hypothetical protein ACA910_018539 [Epithemia clementina (nom. ined.)]